MKISNISAGLALYVSIALLFVSCQKEISNENVSDILNGKERLSGVIEDDPAVAGKVHMFVSSHFVQQVKDQRFHFQYTPGTQESTGYLGRGRKDKTAPRVSIIEPLDNSTVSNAVNIQADATDNVGVTSVTFDIDGSTIAGFNSAPYNYLWNSALVSNGTHTLAVTAKDAAGNSKTVSIQIITDNITNVDIIKPSVSISSPANGEAVSGTVDFQVNASDNVGVSSVKFIIDGNLLGTDQSAPYNFSWNTTTVASGIHTLTAIATDAAGNSGTASITVTLNTTILPPSTLPAKIELLTPASGNQGNEGSCVPFAIAYGARSIEQYYVSNASVYSLNSNIFSPEYVYNQTKFGDCGTGTAIIPVLDLIKTQGVSTWQSMPYSDVNGCSLQPDASQIANAANYKISSYVTIPNSDIIAIKTMISLNHPVITTIIADNSFVNAKTGFIWRSYSGSGSLPHTLVICGYDDSKHAYKVMNSWGATWGDSGFSWIDYDFFVEKSSYYTYAIQ